MDKPTFKVFVRSGDYRGLQIEQSIIDRLTSDGWLVNDDAPDYVIAIGGDGTMLDALRRYQFNPFYIGIHTGTLGFFADWGKEEYHKLLELMIKGNPKIAEYTTIKVDIETKDGIETHYGVNDLVIKVSDLHTLVTSIFINGEPFEVAHGDGVVVSAPCGSTAYNHSLGGAVFHPSMECMQINGVAWIDNVEFKTLHNPVILGRGEVLDIYTPNRKEDYVIGVDGYKIKNDDVYKITAQLADKKVKFARYRPYPFWNRVQDKLIGK